MCVHGHEWTTRPNEAGRSMRCPHCGTVTLTQLKPEPETVERMASVLWAWNAESSGLRDYPYERLEEVTKDDLRALAKRLIAAGAFRGRARPFDEVRL